MKQLLKRWFEIIIMISCLFFLGWLVTYRSSSYDNAYSVADVSRRNIIKSITLSGETKENKDGKYLEVYIPEKNYLEVEDNDKVEITFDSKEDIGFEGKMRSISDIPIIRGNSTDYRAEATIDEFPEDIIKGMHADMKIIIDEKLDRLSIPNISVKKDNDDYFANQVIVDRKIFIQKIHFKKEKKTIKKTTIEIGFEGDEYTEITSGLKNGDTVVSSLY